MTPQQAVGAPPTTHPPSSVTRVASVLRQRVVDGELLPGTRLSEASLVGPLDVSRNTLREAFTALVEEGLLVRQAHRGVSVATLSHAQVADIYRARAVLECACLEHAPTAPPLTDGLRVATDEAERCAAAGQWRAVGTANMRFHEEVVHLAGSPQLDAWMHQLTAELRLAFAVITDVERLHAPYVARNAEILDLYARGDAAGASVVLREYLLTSERVVLGAMP